MSICLRYLTSRQDAEDCLQEAMIKIFKHLRSFDNAKASYLTWSKKIIVNACLEKLRKPGLLNYIGSIFEFGKKATVYSDAIENLNLEDLTKVIQSLPKGYRTVFNMYVIDGFNHNEISEKLKISVSTSKTQLMKARKLLKSKIESEEFAFEHGYA